MTDNSVIAVVFCVVSAVRTFDSRLVINEIPIKWRPVCVKKKTTSSGDGESCFWHIMFPRPSPRVLMDCIHAVKVSCFLLSKWQYMNSPANFSIDNIPIFQRRAQSLLKDIEDFTTLKIQILVFWFMTPCVLIKGDWRFLGKYYFCLEGRLLPTKPQ